jgi:molecular chaperone GrpE (heat shock protein)
MRQFPVQVFKKKQQVISSFKNAAFIKALARINDSNTSYDFYITSDNDDELTNPSLKQLKLKVKSLYNFSDDRAADMEQIKQQFQNDKDVIWIAPDNSFFSDIDKLMDDIERIKYLEEKYTNPNSD